MRFLRNIVTWIASLESGETFQIRIRRDFSKMDSNFP